MNFSETVPTVKIKSKNGPLVINLSDYDPKVHQLADASELPPLKPLDPSKVEALFGSSVQPASWPLPGGKTLTLGEVVAAAYTKSGVSVEEWNKLPNDEREQLIADMAAEMLPDNPPAFSVGHNGARGAKKKWIVFDSAGNAVGEPFDTEEDANAQVELLLGQENA